MQFLSDGPVLVAMVVHTHPRFAEFAQRPEIQQLGTFLLASLVCVELLRILWIWVSSKTVVHNTSSTLLNALKVWVTTWLVVLTVIAVLFVALPNLPRDAAWRLRMVLGGCSLLVLTLIFLVPMKIYVIGFLRAFVVVVLSAFLTGTSAVGVDIALLNVLHMERDGVKLQGSLGKTPAEQQAFFQRLCGFESSDEIDRMLDDALYPIGPQPSLGQREAMVRKLQQKLEDRRRNLGSASSETIKAFPGQLSRYKTLLNEIMAERAKPAAAALR